MNKISNYFIDVLKGICILIVIITHYNWDKGERLKYLFPFWVEMAVPVFMIISGYVSSKSFEKKQINKLAQAYEPFLILSKILRYTIPFIIVYMLSDGTLWEAQTAL